MPQTGCGYLCEQSFRIAEKLSCEQTMIFLGSRLRRKKNPFLIRRLRQIFGAGFQKALQVFDSVAALHRCA
jgi:hypothetical protein